MEILVECNKELGMFQSHDFIVKTGQGSSYFKVCAGMSQTVRQGARRRDCVCVRLHIANSTDRHGRLCVPVRPHFDPRQVKDHCLRHVHQISTAPRPRRRRTARRLPQIIPSARRLCSQESLDNSIFASIHIFAENRAGCLNKR